MASWFGKNIFSVYATFSPQRAKYIQTFLLISNTRYYPSTIHKLTDETKKKEFHKRWKIEFTTLNHFDKNWYRTDIYIIPSIGETGTKTINWLFSKTMGQKESFVVPSNASLWYALRIAVIWQIDISSIQFGLRFENVHMCRFLYSK